MGAMGAMGAKSWRLTLLCTLLLILVLCWMQVRNKRQLVSYVSHGKHYCEPFEPKGLGEIHSLVYQMRLPGVQMAYISPGGELVQCNFGWSRHFPWPRPVASHDRFRYASLTKILVSIVTMQAQEKGLLHFEGRLVEKLSLSISPKDKRVMEITIDHLLRHVGGFDRTFSGDPMLQTSPWCPGRVEQLLTTTLDHSPGAYYSYSNLGYCLLGIVLERDFGKPLVSLLRTQVLDPLGLEEIRPLVQGERLLDEVEDYPDPAEVVDSVRDIAYANLAAVGAWSGSAADFARILYAARRGDALLDNHGRTALFATDETCDLSRWRSCRGYAFYPYQLAGRQRMYWCDGSLPGSTAFAAVFADGSAFVLLGSSRDLDWMPATDKLGQVVYEIFAEERLETGKKSKPIGD